MFWLKVRLVREASCGAGYPWGTKPASRGGFSLLNGCRVSSGASGRRRRYTQDVIGVQPALRSRDISAKRHKDETVVTAGVSVT